MFKNGSCAFWALTLIRIMLGIIFIAHGSQKVFGIFGGPGLEGFATWLGTYGLPHVLAYLAAFAELIGGFLLLFGYFSRIGALMTGAVMVGAILFIHLPNGFFIQNNGIEYCLSLLVSCFAIFIGGPGKMAYCPKVSDCCMNEKQI